MKMIRQLIRLKRRQILVDISTQKDFFLASGKACVGNHRRVLANIRRLMAWARHKSIPVISTCLVYPNNNGVSEINYCIAGSDGQKKIAYTIMNNHAEFVADGNTDLPHDVLQRYQQIVLEKRCVDPFNEPRIERLLSEVRANRFILFGACAESDVKATALGLLQRGKNVAVVFDATGGRNKQDAKLAFRKMETKGARLIETKRLAGSSHLRSVGICGCPMCHAAMVTVAGQFRT